MPIHRFMRGDSSGLRFDTNPSSNGRPSPPSRIEELEHPSCGFAPGIGAAHVYNEEGFRYFLEIERRRSELSMRPFLLLLIDMKKSTALDMRIAPMTSQHLLSALALCVRETDFIGWYHEGRVAGAVLTQHGDAPGTDVPDAVRQRITTALNDGLPSGVAERLQVRVYQLPTNVRNRS